MSNTAIVSHSGYPAELEFLCGLGSRFEGLKIESTIKSQYLPRTTQTSRMQMSDIKHFRFARFARLVVKKINNQQFNNQQQITKSTNKQINMKKNLCAPLCFLRASLCNKKKSWTKKQCCGNLCFERGLRFYKIFVFIIWLYYCWILYFERWLRLNTLNL